MKIRTELLRDVTVSRCQRMLPSVDLNPPYQREGGVWNRETCRTLIDSIINGLDVPKLYFEVATSRRTSPDGTTYRYAVIDGKQRLEAVIDFCTGDLSLSNDFLYFEDQTVVAAGLTLAQLQTQYPFLADRFFDFRLDIVSVTTDSGDLIEEMFQRLNASTALNAAERRNALAGPTKEAANHLADHELLKSRSPIKSARYKYRELGAKFLAIEHQLAARSKIADTKADTLYALFVATRQNPPGTPPAMPASEMATYKARAAETLGRMASVFKSDDELLASIGTVVVYYIVFRDAAAASLITRTKLSNFEKLRREASRMAEDDQNYGRSANARLREYNVFVQSTNDGRALERRAEILRCFLRGDNTADVLNSLDSLGDGDDLPDREEVEG